MHRSEHTSLTGVSGVQRETQRRKNGEQGWHVMEVMTTPSLVDPVP
jgi:hypothetical protein